MTPSFTSLQLLRRGLTRLCLLGLATPDEKLKELRGVGEEGDRDGVGVVGEEEDEEVVVGVEEEDWLLGREDARCSRRRRRWRRAEEKSKASAVRPEADRLARRAFAWLDETVKEGSAPSWWHFLRPGANAAAGEATRPEKMPALRPERYGSIQPVELVPKAFK